MGTLSDEKVASLTRRLVDTVIEYKREAERLRLALEYIAKGGLAYPEKHARAALEDKT